MSGDTELGGEVVTCHPFPDFFSHGFTNEHEKIVAFVPKGKLEDGKQSPKMSPKKTARYSWLSIRIEW